MNTNNDKGATNVERATPVAINTPAALLPYTYDYWREGICGSGPHAPNIVAYNGEDVTGIAYVANDGVRARIIRKHNAIVQRLASIAPVASESRGSVPVGYIVHRAMGAPYFEPYAAVYGLPFGEHDLYVAPTPPAVSNGEPTAEHWKTAVYQWALREQQGFVLGPAWVEQRARELARSAAAKGEG